MEGDGEEDVLKKAEDQIESVEKTLAALDMLESKWRVNSCVVRTS